MSFLRSILGIIVNSMVSSFLDALRRKRRDTEIRQGAKDEIRLEAEKAKNNALEKWRKMSASNKSTILKRLRKGNF
jgi:hypothetical protein